MHKIVKDPDPRLRTICRPVGSDVESAQEVVFRLEEALFDHGAMGIAAPQLGYPFRIICLGNFCQKSKSIVGCTVMIDPCIVAYDRRGKSKWTLEGCLSIPDREIGIIRPLGVKVQWTDPFGQMQIAEFKGVKSTVIQHEIDHLNGVLITDYDHVDKPEEANAKGDIPATKEDSE